jgi:DUF4097 and DUF4098 domain-containing protein YvlB
MPVFDTPEPISVQIDLPVGDAWIKASDRADTVVEVRASNSSSKSDVSAAEQTRVEYADGRLLIKAPKSWRRYSFFGPGSSVDVTIELPSGSSLQADAAWATFRCEGRLGESRFNTGGDLRLDQTGALDVDTSAGGVTVGRAVGHARITTGYGQVRIREVDGPAVIKNSSGACWVGQATGAVRVNTAGGDITVDRALAAVTARTAYGAIRIGEIVRGPAILQTSYGDVEIGIPAGTAAWLDVSSLHGRVHNALDATGAPAQAGETAEIRASTSYGNVTIRRS